MRRLIIRSLAEAEIEQAHLWYAERSPDAARHFLDEIGAVFSRIVENSDQYPQVRSHLRRARMPSFPYGITSPSLATLSAWSASYMLDVILNGGRISREV